MQSYPVVSNVTNLIKGVYPKPSITVDIVVYDRMGKRVLLIKRGKPPFEGYWANPGGFFNSEDHNDEKQDVSLRAAAIRELKEETGIDLSDSRLCASFTFLTIMDKPGRDPRGRTITIVYVLTLWDMRFVEPKAQSDAAALQWFDLDEICLGKVKLAFDHEEELYCFRWGLPYL